jgi:hypothetical protein
VGLNIILISFQLFRAGDSVARRHDDGLELTSLSIVGEPGAWWRKYAVYLANMVDCEEKPGSLDPIIRSRNVRAKEV